MSTSTSNISAEANVQLPASTSRISQAHKDEITQNAQATVENAQETAKSAAGTGRGLWHGSKDVFAGVANKSKSVGAAAYRLPKATISKAAEAATSSYKTSAAAATQGVKTLAQPTSKSALAALTGAALVLGTAAWASVTFDFAVELLAGVMLHHVMMVGALLLGAYVIAQLLKRAFVALTNRATNAAEAVAAPVGQGRASDMSAAEPIIEETAPSRDQITALINKYETRLSVKRTEVEEREARKELARNADQALPGARARVVELEAAKASEDNELRLAAAQTEVDELEQLLRGLKPVKTLEDVGQLRQQVINKDEAINNLRSEIEVIKTNKDAEVQAERDAAKAKIEALESSEATAKAEAEASRMNLNNVRKDMAELMTTLDKAKEQAKEVNSDVREADQNQGEVRASASVQAAA